MPESKLILFCTEEADAVLSSTNVTAEERAVYETVLEKFDAFFQVRRNVIFERARFNQLSGEQYIMELYKLAESCNYEGRDDATGCAALTLDKAKKTVRRQWENKQQLLKGTVKDESSLDQRKGFRKQWKANPRVPTKSNCQRCGRGQHTREKCPHTCQKITRVRRMFFQSGNEMDAGHSFEQPSG